MYWEGKKNRGERDSQVGRERERGVKSGGGASECRCRKWQENSHSQGASFWQDGSDLHQCFECVCTCMVTCIR